MKIFIILLFLANFCLSQQLRVISLNYASGNKALINNGNIVSHEDAVSGLSKLLISKVSEVPRADTILIALQESSRRYKSTDFDVPVYLQHKLVNNTAFTWQFHDSNFNGYHSRSGSYGMTTFYNKDDLVKKRKDRFFGWIKYKELLYAEKLDNNRFQSIKIHIDNEFIWLINFHATSKNLLVTETQVYDLMAHINSLDDNAHVIVVGDFNIYRLGQHVENDCGINTCKAHKIAYNAMRSLFHAKGFTEYPSYTGACFNNDQVLCSFNATEMQYGQLDYAFVRPAKNKEIKVEARFERPVHPNDNKINLTDHMMMIVDIEF